VLRVLKDELPTISDINDNATAIDGKKLVAKDSAIKLNATITDDYNVSTALFTIDGTNQTATRNVNEFYLAQTCLATASHNWSAIYANDTQSQWSSNTSVNKTWYCDADGPNTPSTNITGFNAGD